MLYRFYLDASMIAHESVSVPCSCSFMNNQVVTQMRISADVLSIAQTEQARLGLRNPKEAIESIVRRYSRTPPTEPPKDAPTNV